jgi:hypothetical protein
VTFAGDLYTAMHPLALRDDEEGYALRDYTLAMGEPFEWVCTYALDTDDAPGWSLIMDPATCPAEGLPWLGQFVGVSLVPGYSEAQQRQQIAAHVGFGRGTPAAIAATIAPTLTGTQTVYLAERLGGDPYALGISTRTSETPNPTATQKVALAAVPAGIVVTISVVPGQPYAAAGAGKTYAQWKATYANYDLLKKG